MTLQVVLCALAVVCFGVAAAAACDVVRLRRRRRARELERASADQAAKVLYPDFAGRPRSAGGERDNAL